MQRFDLSAREFVASPWRNRGLIHSLVERDIAGRYRGSVLGILWSLVQPVLMLLVYTFVFSVVFNARWNAASESKTEFALVLFSGLLVFNLFSECLTRAPGLVLSNANYVKKVVFPLEVLPWVSLGAALFHAVVGLAVWLVFHLALFGLPHPTAFWLPVVIVPYCLLTLGLSWFLASLGVYLRDIGQMVGLAMTVLLFVSPVFYPVSALPERYRPLLQLNPLTPAIEMVRDVLIWGRPPDWTIFGVYLLACGAVALGGFAWFQKTRKGFADVI